MSHHGNTPAAWTGVALILGGFVVGGIGMVIDNWTMFWIGLALLPIGGIVGKIMQKMGLGSAPVEDRASGKTPDQASSRA